MESEFTSRNYSLPKGETNRIEAFTKKAQPTPTFPQPVSPTPLPPVEGEVTVPSTMTAQELAQVLGPKPFQIIAALIELGIFANVTQSVEFDVIAKVARRFGVIAKRVEEEK